jgi:hypothetical protein
MTTVDRGPADPVNRPLMNMSDDQRPPQRLLAYAAASAAAASYPRPVPRRPRTPMRLCLICRLPITATEDNVCWHHERDKTVRWADVNRAFCDWLHRGVGRR